MPESAILMPLRSSFTLGDIPGPRRAGALRLWRGRHISCGVAAALLLALAAPSAARQTFPIQAAGATWQDDSGRLPDADQMHEAFTRLREWVDQFETPRMDDALSRVRLSRASGVCVVLRRSGRIMGVGVDMGGDDLMLRRAAGLALNDVLSDPALSNLAARLRAQKPDEPGALTLDAIHAQLGRSLTVELEVAGLLTPLVGRSVEQLAAKVEPGVEGVALRLNQTWASLFPAQLRASNASADPARAILNLTIKAGVPVKSLNDLPARQDLSLYSFATRTLVQMAAGEAPVLSFRGDTLVRPEDVDAESIARFADDLAGRLAQWLWPEPSASIVDESPIGPQPASAKPAREPLGLMGDYSVTADQYRPLVAPPLDQALTAFALNRHGNTCPQEEIARRSHDAAATILRDLVIVTPVEEDPLADASACAAIVFAVMERPVLRQESAIAELLTGAVKVVNESWNADRGFRGELSAHARAMLAGAMCRLLVQERALLAHDEQSVRAALDAAWDQVPQAQQVSLLPWVGWAEVDFATATGQPMHRPENLRFLVQLLDEARIGDADAAHQPDLIGGFALVGESAAGAGGVAASSQSARPAAWIASLPCVPELLDPDAATDLRGRHLNTMRFLMQLSVRESNRGVVRNPARASGGIRISPWNSDQPVAAQALALLAAVETLRCPLEHLP